MAQSKQIKSVSRVIRKAEGFHLLSETVHSELTGDALPLAVPVTIASVALDTLELSQKCWTNVKKWRVGTLSGKKCAKKCAGELIKFESSVGGLVAGVAAGTALLGPMGGIAAGVAGGFLGHKLGKALAKLLFRLLFGHYKEEALQNAHEFLGVKSNASNAEVNAAYRQKALKYHPDKNGDSDKFHQLQLSMALIKMARESASMDVQVDTKIIPAISF